MAEGSASSGRPHGDDDDDEEEAHPNSPVNAEGASPTNSGLYGTFAWSVALPSVPADKDSLADISKIRQFRCVPPFPGG